MSLARQIEALRERKRKLHRFVDRCEAGRSSASSGEFNAAEDDIDHINEQIERLTKRIAGEWHYLDASDGSGILYELSIDGASFVEAFCDDCGGEVAEVIDVDADFDGESFVDDSTYRCVCCGSTDDVSAMRSTKESLMRALARTLFPVHDDRHHSVDPIAALAGAA